MNQPNRTTLKVLVIDYDKVLSFVVMEDIAVAAFRDGYFLDISYRHPLNIKDVDLDYDIVFVSGRVGEYLDLILETLKINTNLQNKIVAIDYRWDVYRQGRFKSVGVTEFVSLVDDIGVTCNPKDVWKNIAGLIVQ